MNFNRRKFIILLGSILGVVSAIYLGKSDTNQDNQFVNISEPEPPLPPLKIAPEGLFAPVKGDVRLVIISDLNSRYGSTTYEPQVTQAVALIPQWKPDLILCVGDMVAGQKLSLSEANIQAMWEGFERDIASPLRQDKLPFAMTMGNHDGSGTLSDQGQFIFEKERRLAQAYWKQHKSDLNLNFIDDSGFPFYYSFLQNEIFYLVWDASTFNIPTQQINWIKNSLASSQAKTAKLRIVMGHLPLYAVAVGRDKFGEVLTQAEELQTVLEENNVHLYISGHHHAYFPAYKNQLKLLHAGALGSGPRSLLNSNLSPRNTLTVVDINLSPKTTVYTTYDMKTLEVINLRELPEKIDSLNRWVLREEG
ncbi:metallophosphoesterase family protein [Limnoraphis robusta]|uniref:Metallophosphoesterase n=1 Tax=Limnoraphis robusta CCNP1315 TaxID=3110306 RepID=A0ABU5U4A0_9CYAN|nr:metallophosphoesterase [Limnoraphis robusta]MEA5521890.1 metallophosphoesterase [Limnoraphis robusta CCNP1315]MEA5544698.1 metallophosphoesterase [Limnoraphis robusta CCNP1324]